jgi:hypothetical protein
MKEERKKGRISETEEDYSRYIEELSHIVTEGMRERRIESLEPFEVYAERIKSKLYADLDESCLRFMKGYQVLLEKLNVR